MSTSVLVSYVTRYGSTKEVAEAVAEALRAGGLEASVESAKKVRTLTVVGAAKMAHWDDVDPQDTLRVFDKGLAEPPYYDSFGEFQCLLRSADMRVPAIPRAEPLLKQAKAFTDWVLDGTPTGPDAWDGLRVVRTLEAATRSMRSGGAMCPVDKDELPAVRTASTDATRIVPGYHPVPSLPESLQAAAPGPSCGRRQAPSRKSPSA